MQQFLGIYRGKVVNNSSFTDPRAGKGRCQIWVPGVHPSEFLKEDQQSQIPWAEPAMPIELGVGLSSGTFTVPEINTVVWVFFEGGDHMRPIYFAVTPNAVSWPAGNIHQHMKVLGNTAVLCIDEQLAFKDTPKFKLKFGDFKPLTTSNSNEATAKESEESTNTETKELKIPGVIVNITKADNNQAHVTAIINGMLNIIATGGATINGLPLI